MANTLTDKRADRAFGHVASGQVSGSATAQQLPNVPYVRGVIKAEITNAGNVYIGSSSAVTVISDATTNTTTGFQLDAGQELPILGTNLNQLWNISDNVGDDITYVVWW